ncbi:MAG TPA: cytochrome c oxidase assembly protein [Blastocatellia bacterium]|nr:cytochrome c oxidase assembly protein [Blastocatellia bacterium]
MSGSFLPARSVAFALTIYIAVCVSSVSAHEGRPPAPHDLLAAWSLEPGVVIGLVLMAYLYIRGVRRVWRQSAIDRGIRRWEAAAFAGGWLALVVALVSPLDAMGGALFSAHMTQHEVLMLIAAPLVVLGRPLVAFLWAMPLNWRRELVRAGKTTPVESGWRFLLNPVAAWLIHALVLWLWHAPALFQATLESDPVHAAQHLSFLVSALLFWEALVYGRDGRMGYGAAVLYVFTTAVHTSVLGALLTFANTLWYPVYQRTTAAWGLTAIEDQQIGGLIMWVPAGVVYIVAGLALFALWLRESERRVLRRENEVLQRS